MILFRDVYKSANNDILANPELLDNILSNKHQKKHNSVYRYTSAAAACFILIGTLAIYPQINKNITSTEDKTTISVSSFEETNNDLPFSENVQPTQEVTPAKTSEKPPVSKARNTAKPENKATKMPETKSEEALPEQELSQESSSIEVASVSIAVQDEDVISQEPAYSETEENEITPQDGNTETLSKARMFSGGSGGGTAPTEAAHSLTESEAMEIADTVFLQDFGEEFLKNTQIKAELNENYSITRFDENESFTVTVFSDGSYEKQY